MAFKKSPSTLQIIGVSAITSVVVSALFLFIYQRFGSIVFAPSTAKAPISSQDPNFTKYETLINNFLDKIRKGKIEEAYKDTSPSFQKLTTLEDFKKLMTGYQTAKAIPTSTCSLIQYSEPFSSSIKGLNDQYLITTTKCEAIENNQTKGFDVEFIDDAGKTKISYINAYSAPVFHKR